MAWNNQIMRHFLMQQLAQFFHTMLGGAIEAKILLLPTSSKNQILFNTKFGSRL